MNDEAFNLSLRRFLKKFGITAQREIEQAVRSAIDSGRIDVSRVLHARATIRIPDIGLDAEITGEIELD
jgi:Family of unknown function (DUF6494)